MEEKVFFSNGSVRVTSTRFIVGSQTYAMSGITSVKASEIPPPRGLPIALGILGLLLLVLADGLVKVLGLGLIGLAVWIFTKQRPVCAVVLSSSSGEVQALDDSMNPHADIRGVVSALNEAIIYRG